MSAQQAIVKELLSGSRQQSPSYTTPENIRNVAMMAASGSPIVAIVARTGLTLSRIQHIMMLPEYRDELLAMAQETGSTETAEKMLRGSLVDSVMRLVRLRDASTNERLVFDICKFFVQQNLGQNKMGLSAKEMGDMLSEAMKSGGDVAAALDTDLARLITGDPQVLAAVNKRVRDDGYSGTQKQEVHGSSPASSVPLSSTGVTEPGQQGDIPGRGDAGMLPRRVTAPTAATETPGPVCPATPALTAELL